ncbi:MAG TPA: hypothetical protein VFQ92_14455, partial [Blastocatellia bacterium]|nr:hypothetical protein [Blastocatellia bacterium]
MSDKRVELEKIGSRDEAALMRPGSHREPDYMDAYLYGYDHEATGNNFHLRNVWRAIRKHKWLVSIIPLLATLLITVEVNRPRPIYEASATVELKKDAWVMIKTGDTVIEEEADTALSLPTVKTNSLLIKSRPLLQDVAARLALDREPDFFEITRKKKSFLETLRSLSPMDSAQEKAPAREEARHYKTGVAEQARSETPPGETAQPTPISEERKSQLGAYVGVLNNNLNVEPISNTRLLKITFMHTNPRLAAIVANGVAESFIDRSYQNKTSRFNRATAW